MTNARAMLLSGFTTVRAVGTYRALNDIRAPRRHRPWKT